MLKNWQWLGADVVCLLVQFSFLLYLCWNDNWCWQEKGQSLWNTTSFRRGSGFSSAIVCARCAVVTRFSNGMSLVFRERFFHTSSSQSICLPFPSVWKSDIVWQCIRYFLSVFCTRCVNSILSVGLIAVTICIAVIFAFTKQTFYSRSYTTVVFFG